MRHKYESTPEHDMHIRTLAEADADAFKALRLLAIADSPAAVWPTFEEEAQRSNEEIHAKIKANATQLVLGAFDAGKLIGIAGLRREALVQVAHKATVWGVFVRPEARTSGVARQLLMRIKAHALQAGIIQIQLSVNAENLRAKNLYLSLGFATFGIEPRAMRVGERYYDEEHMCLRLDA